jgi:hypothetical protein
MHRSPINLADDAGYAEQHSALFTAGDAHRFSLDELSRPKCRRIPGGGNAIECSRWSLLGSCETDDLPGAQQESAVRVQIPSHGSTDARPAGRQEEEKLLIRNRP